MNKTVSRLKLEAVEYYKKAAKQESKSKIVKEVLKTIKDHFEKDGWPLDYEHYKENSKLHIPVFNQLLELNGYTIKYVKKYSRIYIVKRKTK